jgi:hypothetical protein
MKTYNNLLSPEECESFKTFWKNNKDKSYVNWEFENEVLDRRLEVTSEYTEHWDIIRRITETVFNKTYDIWSAYQEQSFCHNVHTDDYSLWTQSEHGTMYTIILSLDNVSQFKTIVWQDECADNEELSKKIRLWELKKNKKCSDISQQQDLEHTVQHNEEYFCDYLNLDDVYTYKQGGGAAFKATQLHCTSNWKKYPQFKNRQLLQIHALADYIQ